MQIFQLTEENHVITHNNVSSGIVLHFYTLEVSPEKLKEIERKTLDSHDHGGEVSAAEIKVNVCEFMSIF